MYIYILDKPILWLIYQRLHIILQEAYNDSYKSPRFSGLCRNCISRFITHGTIVNGCKVEYHSSLRCQGMQYICIIITGWFQTLITLGRCQKNFAQFISCIVPLVV